MKLTLNDVEIREISIRRSKSPGIFPRGPQHTCTITYGDGRKVSSERGGLDILWALASALDATFTAIEDE